jgi:DNA polymerase III subunit delta
MSGDPLKPVYLLAGSDRPKRTVALRRLRDRFGPESVETLSADVSSGAEAVAACNALGLFAADAGRAVVVHGVEQWRKPDLEAVSAYLSEPVPDTVLVLVAEQLPRDSALVALCKKRGDVLRYDVPKPTSLHVWVKAQFEQAGATVDSDAARALVELVGDDVVALANEVTKIVAWANGDPIGRREIELLAAPGREAAAWALTDAWGTRDLVGLLRACELALERKEPFSLAVGLASHVGRVRAAQALAEEGLRSREVAARLRIKEFPARKVLQHSENYSREELDAALVRLAELDAALKGASRLSAELELERALVDITRPAERGAAANV